MEEELKDQVTKSADSGELCEEDAKSGETTAIADNTLSGDDSGDSAKTGNVPESTEEKIDALKQGLSALQELTESISFKLDQNDHREELIDKLHTENQAYKSDLYKKFIMPLVNEIVFLIDGYTKLCKSYAQKDISEIDTQKLLKQFSEVVDDLENALYKNGIEAYEAQEGAAVDFTRQKVLKTIPTNEIEKDKTVCDRLKKGFILDDKIIRQEQITCYKFEK